MLLLYLLLGFLLYAAAGTAPGDPLRDIQTDSRRPARWGEIFLAVTTWCVALAVWPLALLVRATYTLTRRDR